MTYLGSVAALHPPLGGGGGTAAGGSAVVSAPKLLSCGLKAVITSIQGANNGEVRACGLVDGMGRCGPLA